jgi:hypothetical protein
MKKPRTTVSAVAWAQSRDDNHLPPALTHAVRQRQRPKSWHCHPLYTPRDAPLLADMSGLKLGTTCRIDNVVSP